MDTATDFGFCGSYCSDPGEASPEARARREQEEAVEDAKMLAGKEWEETAASKAPFGDVAGEVFEGAHVLREEVEDRDGVTTVRVFASMPGGGVAYLTWRSDDKGDDWGDEDAVWAEMYDEDIQGAMMGRLLRFPTEQAFDDWCNQGLRLHDKFHRAMGLPEIEQG